MYHLNVKTATSGEIVFSDLFFNDEENLEFNYANSKGLFLQHFRFIFNEEKGALDLKSEDGKLLRLKLEEVQVEELKGIRKEVRASIVNFYKKILKGEEQLFFLPTLLEDFPYIITSPTIIKAEIQSPKYEKALLYVFSDKILKSKKMQPLGISDAESMHRVLGEKIRRENYQPNIEFEGIPVICLPWQEVVS